MVQRSALYALIGHGLCLALLCSCGDDSAAGPSPTGGTGGTGAAGGGGTGATGGGSQAQCVSQNGIDWCFDGTYEVGQFYLGDWWVVGPVTVTSVSPAWDGERHGSMVDPSAAVEAQGYRQGLDCPYDESLRAEFPLTLAPTSSLISTIGLAEVETTGSHSGIESGAVLTVVESSVVEGSFRPAYVDGDKTIYHPSQMNTALLPRLTPPGDVPVGDHQDTLTKVYVDHSPGGGNRGATLHPTENGPPYGRDFSIAVSHLALMALLDIPEADDMAARLTQLGIDFFPIWQDNLGNVHGGGFGHGRKWPLIFAGLMLDHDGMQHPPADQPGNPLIRKFVEDRSTSYGEPDADWPSGRPLWGYDCENGDGTPGGTACRDPAGLVQPDDGYRTCCSSHTWVGQALAARLLGVMDLWDHPAYFDYVDEWVATPEDWVYGGQQHPDIYGYGGAFIQDMYNAFR